MDTIEKGILHRLAILEAKVDTLLQAHNKPSTVSTLSIPTRNLKDLPIDNSPVIELTDEVLDFAEDEKDLQDYMGEKV